MRKIVLHVCCGPCSTHCVRALRSNGYESVLYFSNSNIDTESEWERRAASLRRFAEAEGVEVRFDPYNPESWNKAVAGLEGEPEGGARCERCFAHNLLRAAKFAHESGIDAFTTSLTVSPHKKSALVHSAGSAAATTSGGEASFEPFDFKKSDGFLDSINISSQYALYRQSYCGCKFSHHGSMPLSETSVAEFGATGGGTVDDTAAIQRALDSDFAVVRIPTGRFKISAPLRIPGGKMLEVASDAVIEAEGLDCAVICERDTPVASDIFIRGGVWSGAQTIFWFAGVRELSLENVVLSGFSTGMRLERVDGFSICRVTARGSVAAREVVRIHGCTRLGSIANVASELLALENVVVLSADSASLSGPIEHIALKGINAAFCACGVRVESSRATVRGLSFVDIDVPASSSSVLLPAEPPAREFVSPVRFPTHILLEKGLFQVTSPYGWRTHPVTGQKGTFHAGVDGALWNGHMLVETGICAFSSGIVLEATDTQSAQGSYVAIDHGGGLVSKYFHLERGSIRVHPGMKVRKGFLLGWMGRTGRSTGEHLHFQLEKYSVAIDPMPYLT